MILFVFCSNENIIRIWSFDFLIIIKINILKAPFKYLHLFSGQRSSICIKYCDQHSLFPFGGNASHSLFPSMCILLDYTRLLLLFTI